jgi:hypothetical protein
VRSNRNRSAIRLAAPFANVANEFLTRIELCSGRLIAIEISDQTNSQGNVVEKIAMDMSAIDLTPPPIAHFNLPVAGGSAIADHKMISETILHPPYVSMVVVKHASVALPRPTIVDDNEFPAVTRYRCPPNFVDNRAGQKPVSLITRAGARPRPKPYSTRRRRRRRFQSTAFFETGFFDGQLRARVGSRACRWRGCGMFGRLRHSNRMGRASSCCVRSW